LPDEIKKLVKEKFRLWLADLFHASLQFKQVNKSKNIWSARINDSYRSIDIRPNDHFAWFWLGNHAEYERRIK